MINIYYSIKSHQHEKTIYTIETKPSLQNMLMAFKLLTKPL